MPSLDVATDTDLAERFRSGDEHAVRSLYALYGRLVFTVALRVLGDRQLAEDATQQTFVQAWRAAATFDPARELAPWLATIARRVALDIHRSAARRPATSLEVVGEHHPALLFEPATHNAMWEAWQVRAAVDELPADEREVVRLQHLEGHTHAAIAQRMGIPLGTVKSRSSRAHRHLADRLRHLREPDGVG